MADERPPEKGTRLTAVEIHDNILGPARLEMRRPAASLFWSSLASGLVIGFSFLLGAFAAATVPDRYDHAAASAAYPLGFILVIMARSELFTENTLVPVITIIGLQVGALIAFAIITETVFQWPGMGLLFIQSVQNADIPVMSAYLMLVAFMFVAINFIVDLLYVSVDPRIRILGSKA